MANRLIKCFQEMVAMKEHHRTAIIFLIENAAQKRIYVQDTAYKLYDITNNNNFYNLQKDSLEQFPIPDAQLTPAEKKIKKNFQNVLADMHN
jgi:hypothetical protein